MIRGEGCLASFVLTRLYAAMFYSLFYSMIFFPKSQNFTNPILKYRQQRGFTQIQLAQLIGVRHKTLLDWEKTRFAPDRGNQEKLAKVFGLDLEKFSKEIKLYFLLWELEELIFDPSFSLVC